jgi:hypothetical protein
MENRKCTFHFHNQSERKREFSKKRETSRENGGKQTSFRGDANSKRETIYTKKSIKRKIYLSER